MAQDKWQDATSATESPPTMNWLTRLYLWACERLYDELAWAYDLVSWLVSLGRWARWRSVAIRYLVNERAGLQKDVLEIGFGTGSLLVELAQAAAGAAGSVVGLELSPAMQKVASAKLQRQCLRPPRVRAPAQQMPFADGSFDAIVATFPASYIFDPQTLRECARVLRSAHQHEAQPGGQLLIVGTWVSFNPTWLQRLGLPFYGQPTPVWHTQICQRMQQAGFEATFESYQDGVVAVSVIWGRKQR